MKAVQSTEHDDNEILDYTGSPRHCVATSRGVATNTKWWDDYQQSQLEFPAQSSPDPWAIRRQTDNTTSRDHVYKVAKEDEALRQFDFSEADTTSFSHLVTTSKASLTTHDGQSTTSTITTSVAFSIPKYSKG